MCFEAFVEKLLFFFKCKEIPLNHTCTPYQSRKIQLILLFWSKCFFSWLIQFYLFVKVKNTEITSGPHPLEIMSTELNEILELSATDHINNCCSPQQTRKVGRVKLIPIVGGFRNFLAKGRSKAVKLLDHLPLWRNYGNSVCCKWVSTKDEYTYMNTQGVAPNQLHIHVLIKYTTLQSIISLCIQITGTEIRLAGDHCS